MANRIGKNTVKTAFTMALCHLPTVGAAVRRAMAASGSSLQSSFLFQSFFMERQAPEFGEIALGEMIAVIDNGEILRDFFSSQA